jgi:hypothetical protein
MRHSRIMDKYLMNDEHRKIERMLISLQVLIYSNTRND